MKTFKDLEFKTHHFGEGIQSIIYFDNSYGASVIRSPFSYGGNSGKYELAIYLNRVVTNDETGEQTIQGSICYDTHITNDVIGDLTEEEVTDYLRQIQEL